ncbi:MAG: glycerophosphodiester phosphodiesterase family protein [Pseudomonadota bacterium]
MIHLLINVIPRLSLLGTLVLATGCELEAPPTITAPTEAWFADVDLPAYLNCARENQVTLVQAHRAGPRPGVAENSLGAINASLADGALFVEIDVSQTADGELVLLHDDTLDRTTTGSGTLRSKRYRDLADIKLVDNRGRVTDESIPTLAEALTLLDGRGVAQIDIKRGVPYDDVAKALRKADALDRSIVISYSAKAAKAFHRRAKQAILSVGIDDPRDLTELQNAGIDLNRVTVWIGLGSGKPKIDEDFAEFGIETSYGDFSAERRGRANYRRMAANGAEILSVDNISDATAALDALKTSRQLLADCAEAL